MTKADGIWGDASTTHPDDEFVDIELYIAFYDEGNWRRVGTGLRGEYYPQHGEFVVPFNNEMTAEEVARIVAASIKGHPMVPQVDEDS